MNELKIENLYVSYNDGDKNCNTLNVLENYSLDVKSGELVVILGPSGCGKSTLLMAISGLKKPTSGKISFGNTCFYDNKHHIDIQPEQRNIGFVFQSYALWPHMTVTQNITFPLKSRKVDKANIRKKLTEILEIVHMSGYEDKYPEELSGGEKQRIALARSLVYQPSLLLLDEPMANLDANLKSSLTYDIKAIQQKLGITTVYVTHDQSEAFEIADRIVIMNKGKIMQIGTPQEVYSEGANLFVESFIGKNNIFRIENNNLLPFLNNCKTNKSITIRPEDIIINNSGKYHGTVKEVHYKGNQTEYILSYNDCSLLVFSQSDIPLRVGEDVAFDIKKYRTFDMGEQKRIPLNICNL